MVINHLQVAEDDRPLQPPPPNFWLNFATWPDQDESFDLVIDKSTFGKLRHPRKTKISKMMGFGKGGLRLKIWPFLISMLDFWIVNCKLMGNSDCFEDLFLDCTPWNWQKTNKKTQSWMPSLIVGLSTPCGPVHFLDDKDFGSLISDLSNPFAKSSC